MKRLIAALAALVVAGLGCAPGAAAAVPTATAVVYTYDGHHHVAAWTSTTTERGPPSSTYGYTTYDAVDRWSHGASAHPDVAAASTTMTYDHPGLIAQVARTAGTTTRPAPRVDGDLCPFQRWQVAAETVAELPGLSTSRAALEVALTPSGGHLVREDLHHGKTASGVHS